MLIMRALYPILTLAGTIPFIACAICIVLDVAMIPWFGNTQQVLCAYGLVIATFMVGSHWGQHLRLEGRWQILLPIFSNLFAIFLWIGFLVMPFKPLLSMFVATFLAILAIDKQLLKNNTISEAYFHIRCLATVIVTLALIISVIFV